jgi:hypothetical protein
MLDLNNIPYKKQVTINKSGIIVGFNEKKGKCYHIIDFVIGENIEVGKSITEYKVITTCRERWTQDDWSYTKLYILFTISVTHCKNKNKEKRDLELERFDTYKIISNDDIYNDGKCCIKPFISINFYTF